MWITTLTSGGGEKAAIEAEFLIGRADKQDAFGHLYRLYTVVLSTRLYIDEWYALAVKW